MGAGKGLGDRGVVAVALVCRESGQQVVKARSYNQWRGSVGEQWREFRFRGEVA